MGRRSTAAEDHRAVELDRGLSTPQRELEDRPPLLFTAYGFTTGRLRPPGDSEKGIAPSPLLAVARSQQDADQLQRRSGVCSLLSPASAESDLRVQPATADSTEKA